MARIPDHSSETEFPELPDRAGQTIPDPNAVKMLLQVLLQARKLTARQINFRPTADFFVVEFAAISGEDTSIIQTLSLKREMCGALYLTIADRLAVWPDTGDNLFCTNNKKIPRLLVAPDAELRVLADIVVRRPLGKEAVLILSNIEYDNIPPLYDILSLSKSDLAALKTALKSRTGLILANSSAERRLVDGISVILALRPDALLFPQIHSAQAFLDALEKSQSALVVVAIDRLDPIELLLQALGFLDADQEKVVSLAKSLVLTFVHRQVKRVCASCARPTAIPAATIERLPQPLRPDSAANYLFGRGCEICGHAAYRGMVGIDSILLIDDQIKKLIGQGGSTMQIAEIAYRHGARSLLEDGLAKIYAGLTSFEEVLRVVSDVSATMLAAIVRHSSKGAETPKDEKLAKVFNAISDDFFVSPSDDSPKAEVPRTDRRSVLVVEDNDEQRDVLSLVFRSEGYEVLTATGGKTAIELLRLRGVDIIVCDIMMPEMDGREFLRTVRKTEGLKNIPVIMLTAVQNPDAEFTLLSEGADDYCEKTVQRRVLLKRVERLLQKRKKNPVEHLLVD